ncbi:hypothetical protein SBOR_6191 [Sclerotinia borealis F-4128]|uniref:Uncharacterized protein n=1 Tax=Sclerotinia borealis (strain F-4128) TaxID=1432307 RepID=W9CFW5_SCLBF|nr:hypothetical protein SBOR_6191 [Sclerotinia borealis F-4128]
MVANSPDYHYAKAPTTAIYVHELSHPIELHFYQFDEKKNHNERLAIIANDRQGGVISGSQMKHSIALLCGSIKMATHTIERELASELPNRMDLSWGVYTILGYELSEVTIICEEAEEDRLEKRMGRMVSMRLGLEEKGWEEYGDLKSKWGNYGAK